jgi:Spy/CpxP family protein refolding chaperone
VNSWKVILATMVIFGTGVVTGGLLVRSADHGRDRRPQRTGGAARTTQPSPAGVMRMEFLRRMQQELELTPEQRDPIDKVLKVGQERVKKLMETIEPRRREEYKKTIDEFRKVLTPEQQTRFDKLLKQQQQRPREQRKAASPRERPSQGRSPTNPPAGTNS